MVTLENILKEQYTAMKLFIKSKNVEAEREYFNDPSNNVPLVEMMNGKSYEENFEYFKRHAKEGNEETLNQIFSLLQELFLFSAGHDMMFKTKLKADIYVSEPLDTLIFPRLESAVKAKYSDFSFLSQNPNREKNIEGVKRTVHVFAEAQSLLYLLYYNDFQFSNGWEGLFPGMSDEILTILKEDGMTIGEFLNVLIHHKCNKMKDIFSHVENFRVRSKYLQKVEDLRQAKLEETSKFAHVHLPVTYFYDHTFLDFMEESANRSSILLGEPKPTKAPKIILPNNPK